jgi:hypothetical protein
VGEVGDADAVEGGVGETGLDLDPLETHDHSFAYGE